jgi:pimeloyl-ACP methyl ester carboxylesterase
VLLIHGFLDDATVWDDVVTALGDRVGTVRYDLPGFGSRTDTTPEPASVTLETLTAEAAAILAGIDGPVIVVGQSLGSQIADGLATAHPDRVAALILLTPVPLAGTHLAEAALAPLRALGGDPAGQRAMRSQLSPSLTAEQLQRLTQLGALVHRETTARYVDLFNEGSTAEPPTSYPGPVRVITGSADGFVTADIVAAVTTRHPQAHASVIARGGHWLHVEESKTVAAAILDMVDDIAERPATTEWQRGFAQQSAAVFADSFTDDVYLEASVLRSPVRGRQHVAAVMAAASAIYETLEFTDEATDGSTTYLQWHATAFGAEPIDGVTIFRRDSHGSILSAAIHHRPLGAVLRFSATLRDRLSDVIPAEHFLTDGDTTSTAPR